MEGAVSAYHFSASVLRDFASLREIIFRLGLTLLRKGWTIRQSRVHSRNQGSASVRANGKLRGAGLDTAIAFEIPGVAPEQTIHTVAEHLLAEFA